MIRISVCMIVKDEADVLDRCLTCVKQFADEIVILDTGSSDRTKEIAYHYTDHVYDFTWEDDFSKARNASFQKASMEYCMWCDADDVICDEDIQKINELKKQLDPDVSIVLMKYDTAFDELGNPTFSYFRERLIKRCEDHPWMGIIHEIIELRGTLFSSDIHIQHRKGKVNDPDRNLRLFEQQLQKGCKFSSREQFYYARELYYHKRYRNAIEKFTQFLKEGKGWVENNIEALEMMGYCYEALREDKKAFTCYVNSFIYDVPRGELCCDIANFYFKKQQFEKAIFFYRSALLCTMQEKSGAFIRRECYGYIPCIQLCVCYYQIHDVEKAIAYNELAASYKESEAVRNNRKFFQKENSTS